MRSFLFKNIKNPKFMAKFSCFVQADYDFQSVFVLFLDNKKNPHTCIQSAFSKH